MIELNGFPTIPIVKDANMLVSGVPNDVKYRLRRVFASDGTNVVRFIPWGINSYNGNVEYDAYAVNSYQGGDMSTLPGCKFSQGISSYQNSSEDSSYKDTNHRCFRPSVIWGNGNDIKSLSSRNYSEANAYNGSISWDSNKKCWAYFYSHSIKKQNLRYSAYCLSLHRCSLNDVISPKITKMVIELLSSNGTYLQDLVVDNDDSGRWKTWYSSPFTDDGGTYGYVVRLDIVSEKVDATHLSLFQGVRSPEWIWKFRDSDSIQMPLAMGAYVLETGFLVKWLDYIP